MLVAEQAAGQRWSAASSWLALACSRPWALRAATPHSIAAPPRPAPSRRDHAGGNKKLAQLLPELEIVGGAGEAVPAVTLAVGNGEALSFGELEVTALATP